MSALPLAGRRPEQVPGFVRDLPNGEGGDLALFDADGTLWLGDVADDFTLWLMQEGRLSGVEWPTYQRLLVDDLEAATLFFPALYTGLAQQSLVALVEEFWEQHARRRWIVEVVATLVHLEQRGFAAWVVSGTPTAILTPLRRLLPIEEILGLELELDGTGRITGRHAGIPTAGEGKVARVRQAAGERRVRFACGNSVIDGPMLCLAEVAWAIHPDTALGELALERGWPILPQPGLTG